MMEIGLAISIFLYALYGEPTYDKVKPTGKYAVGFKEFTTHELWNDCSVFYPVDQDVAEAFKDNVPLLRYAKSLSGLKNSYRF